MEEEKAAAYYDELTRKGSGAARFKQGLGFTSSSSRESFNRASASSLFGNFVRAAKPSIDSDIQKQNRIENIQNKLKKKTDSSNLSNERNRRRSRSRSRERRRSPTNYDSRGGNYRSRRRSSRCRSRSRSRSNDRRNAPSRREDRSVRGSHGEKNEGSKKKNARTDYSQLIGGYSQMTPAERVKAKMKFQLSQTADKDTSKGVTSGWERFDFDKDAPLDDDDEIEVAEDDVALVKDIGRSFRLTAVESKREEEVKAAHDQAMFGTPAFPAPEILETEKEEESNLPTKVNGQPLISEKALASQGSWRDRIRKVQSDR